MMACAGEEARDRWRASADAHPPVGDQARLDDGEELATDGHRHGDSRLGDATSGDSNVGGGDGDEPYHADPDQPADTAFGDGDSTAAVGDTTAGDNAPSIGRYVFYQTDQSAVPDPLHPADARCVGPPSVFILQGPPIDVWRVTSMDLLNEPLAPIPTDSPGELVPEYLGGGQYTEEGYATVAGAELPETAATITIDIGDERWVITNTCPGPLLAIWVYENGTGGDATALDSGAEICPAAAPWALAVEAPLAAEYQALVFDFDTGGVDEYDEVTLIQDNDGLIFMPPLPAWGRVELNLLNANGEEVESVAIYLEC